MRENSAATYTFDFYLLESTPHILDMVNIDKLNFRPCQRGLAKLIGPLGCYGLCSL
jgi:hypothetical protein